jgi:DNA (cytosine-5)-methyltransferase 1
MKIGTLFSGGEGVGIGAKLAGVQHAWGVECDPEIAGVAQQNGFAVTVGDVTQVNPQSFPYVDILHASPPCPNFSAAKTGGKETAQDIALAEAVGRFVSTLSPRFFTLENVYQYRKSESWRIIAETLHALGYAFNYWHLCAADYGVPQTRRRMIVIARRDGRMPQPPEATHAPIEEISPMFDDRQPWIGWYEAIEDLIPDLPDSEFAPWQMERLPEELRSFLATTRNANGEVPPRLGQEPSLTVGACDYKNMPRAFILSNAATQWGDGVHGAQEPSLTVSQQHAGRLRAFIVNESSSMEIRQSDQPTATQVASDRSGNQRAYVAGRVVQMTPRCLARFQSFLDWYILPESKALACRVIGNAVPPMLYKAIIESI